MAFKWVALEKGIRFRYHETRRFRHKGSTVSRRDRYFSIRYTVRKETIESGIGWESEGTTIDDCRDKLRTFKLNAKLSNGQPTRMSELFSENEALRRQNIAIKEFIETLYLPYSLSVKTADQARKEREHCSKWIIPLLGERRLKDLESDGVVSCLELKKTLDDAGKSPRLIELVLITLRRVFQYAEKKEIVQGKLDLSDVKKNLKINNARQRFLTRDEADGLIGILRKKDERLADVAEFSLLTAARQGEVFGIKWQDVSLETKSVLLRDTKNGHDRNLYLTEKAVAIIRKQPSGNPQDHVFRDESGNSYKRLPRSWTVALNESGLNAGITDTRLKVCWHSLRHTAASWLAIAGVDLYKVAKVLGHRDLRMTQRYSHLSEESIRQAVESVMGGQ